MSPTTRRAAISGASIAGLLGGSARAMAVQPCAGAAGPDAALIRLGALLDAAWAAERWAWALADAGDDRSDEAYAPADAALQETAAIVVRIETLAATTVAGLAVKRRALGWCRGDRLSAAQLADMPTPASDFRIIAGILDDLAAMGGVQA